LKAHTIDSDTYAECYYKNRSSIDEQALVILELISNLIGDISKVSVLDVGSGPGRLAIPIGKKVHKVVCIESDLSAVNYLKNRAKRNKLEIEVFPSKLENLSSEEVGHFDLVILSHIIHWFDVSILLNLASKYIVDNGYILLSYFDLENLKNMLFYKISGNEILKIQEDHTISTSQVENFLNSAGFNIIHRGNTPLNVNYGDKKLEKIINNAGTLAWQKAKAILSKKEYRELTKSALTRLNNEPILRDTEYRTIIVAQKRLYTNDLD